MENPTATPTRSVRYECLCQKCGDQFELPAEDAPHICAKCSPAVLDGADDAVAAAKIWILRIESTQQRGVVMVTRDLAILGWFGSADLDLGPGLFCVPVAGGPVLTSVRSVGAQSAWVSTGLCIPPFDA